MGQRYNQITGEERSEIAQLSATGQSIRQIASALDRSPSSIAIEVKRNSNKYGKYQPVYALS